MIAMAKRGGTLPDPLWVERVRRRAEYERVRDDRDAMWDPEDWIRRTFLKQCRAIIAEVHDTSLRWSPHEAVGYRKLADAYWDIYSVTDTETNLKNARKYLRIAIRLQPDNWLQYWNLGVVLETLGELRQALATYREALRLATDPNTCSDLREKCSRLERQVHTVQPALELVSSPNGNEARSRRTASRPVDRERVEGIIRAGMRIEHTRDKSLREEALRVYGPICMLCGRDMRDYYPQDLARAAVEVHHIVPVSQSEPARTGIDDLWVLCANCHNVLHAWLNKAAANSDHLRQPAVFKLLAEKGQSHTR
ncbi:MAG: HNH endonuclease [Armatimonadota bacterium]